MNDLLSSASIADLVVHIFQDKNGVVAIDSDYTAWFIRLTDPEGTIVLPEVTHGMEKLHLLISWEKECRLKWIDDMILGDVPRHMDKNGGRIYLEFITFGDDTWYLIKKVQFQNKVI